MKKIVTFGLSVILVLSFTNANAKIRRVGYPGTPVANTDYTGLQQAHDAASTGDTLLIFPGGWGADFKKKLVVIGYGYFLKGTGADSGLQVITGDMSVSINFYAGSDSSVCEGLDNFGATLRTDIQGIVIKGCRVNIGGFGSKFINWKITGSFVSIYNNYTPTWQNALFENNVFTAADFTNGVSSTGIFNNNIFTTTPNFRNAAYSFYNNIFLSTAMPSNINNCIFDYNIASNNAIPNNAPYTHNKVTVDLSTVFVAQGTSDGKYMLAAGSPAKNAGKLGDGTKTDCGIFGGDNPYHLAGIPPIPAFYKLTAPSNIAGSNPYTITFSVRSNN